MTFDEYSDLLLDAKTKNRVSAVSTYILLFILVAFVAAFYFFSIVPIDGQSMENTIQDNKYCLVLKRGFTVNRGDIVTINTAAENEKEHIIIKRVIGLGGDKLIFMRSQDGKTVNLYICKNGNDHFKLQKEPYIKENMVTGIPYNNVDLLDYKANLEQIDINSNLYTSEIFKKTITIPKNEVFFLGDNRNLSKDSRYYGTLNISKIKAKYLFTL